MSAGSQAKLLVQFLCVHSIPAVCVRSPRHASGPCEVGLEGDTQGRVLSRQIGFELHRLTGDFQAFSLFHGLH